MTLLNAVIDLYHQSAVDDSDGFHQIKEAGILGVIHKASQGIDSADPEYEIRRVRALSIDLLWGAYHFGTGSDGAEQADHFLSVCSPQPGQLLALDFEPNPVGSTMKLAQAEAFVTHIEAVTGRYPVLYSGQAFFLQQIGKRTAAQTVLSRCPLWVARYGPNLPEVPPAFDSFALWQYTDGALGLQPHSVPGVGRCDRNKFNGDAAALNTFWGETGGIGRPTVIASN